MKLEYKLVDTTMNKLNEKKSQEKQRLYCHVYMNRSLSWIDTGTSIKSGGVKQILKNSE